ncbi:MAG: hypothetical protein PHS93_10055 [Candidatus Omnitrophica bacterium]|nr:hypothetical protein [Candidatus Omnitrophota bacterium]MDD5551500.1 hypothetical protein [Candidatus Omnitrophota bacterium]
MTIKTTKNDLILRIPLRQKSYDAVGSFIGYVPNVVGVIIRKNDIVKEDEYWLYYLIDLGYKNDQQLGAEIIELYDEKELKDLCEKAGTVVWEYERCDICGKELWDCFTWKDGKNICFDCERKSS